MDEIMESIVALVVVVIVSIFKFAGQTKKVRNNAPGKAAAPARRAVPEKPVMKPAAPQNASPKTERPVPAAPTVRPTVAPSVEEVQTPSFWREFSNTLKEEFGLEEPVKTPMADGHEAVGNMPEGNSRECEHGSVGGSMAYEGHEEGGQKKPAVRAAAANGGVQKKDLPYRPAMNAQEMRKAVVMAEILKRPQDRMAEQARRWNVR